MFLLTTCQGEKLSLIETGSRVRAVSIFTIDSYSVLQEARKKTSQHLSAEICAQDDVLALCAHYQPIIHEGCRKQTLPV